jgi:hypothetical protein
MGVSSLCAEATALKGYHKKRHSNLGEEHRLRVFENRVLRRIFGPKREEDGS